MKTLIVVCNFDKGSFNHAIENVDRMPIRGVVKSYKAIREKWLSEIIAFINSEV